MVAVDPLRELLRGRAFRTLWVGQSVSSVGDAVTPVALIYALVGEGRGNASDIGVVLAVLTLSQLVLLLTGGAWADRVDRILAMIGSDVVRGTCQISIAAILADGGGNVWALSVAAAVYGSASAFFRPAASALTPEVCASMQLQEANALLSLTRKSIAVGAPIAAGAAVTVVGAANLYLLDGATFLVNVMMLLRLRTLRSVAGIAPRSVTVRRRSLRREIAAGWREVSERSWLVATIAAMSVANLSTAMFVVVAPALLLPRPGGVAEWGVLLGVSAAGAAAGGLLALHHHPRRPLLASLVCLVPLALQLLVLAYIQVVVLVVVVRFAAMVAVFFSNAVWAGVLQRWVSPAVLGRVSSFDWFGSVASVPVGNLIAAVALSAGRANLAMTAVAVSILLTCALAIGSQAIRSADSGLGVQRPALGSGTAA